MPPPSGSLALVLLSLRRFCSSLKKALTGVIVSYHRGRLSVSQSFGLTQPPQLLLFPKEGTNWRNSFLLPRQTLCVPKSISRVFLSPSHNLTITISGFWDNSSQLELEVSSLYTTESSPTSATLFISAFSYRQL